MPPNNQLPEKEKCYALCTDSSYHIAGIHEKWKAAVWSPM